MVNSARVVLRADGRPKYIIGAVEDVTDRKVAEAPYLAEHDQLTDLPHGAALQKHLEIALGEARAAWETLAVLRLDLDRTERRR